MTDNHLLLYRIAELMLTHEQHILPVDLLFDDEQIGDFVKSIQIDSPYQQMLFEGVLTETVRDEKLYVSFTVEGYFHLVLGEVIYNRTEGRGPEELKYIVDLSKLNGVREGVEQCLIRDVKLNDLSRLMWLIHREGYSLEVCSVPLAHAFLQINGNPRTNDEVRLAQETQIRKVMDKLLLEATDNDINALEKALNYLDRKQKKHAISIAYQQVSNSIQPTNLKKAMLYLWSLRFIPESKLPNKIGILETINFEYNTTESYASFLGRLGSIYCLKNIADYSRAILLFNQALEINLKRYPKSYRAVSVNYNELGLAYMLKEEFDKAIENYTTSLRVQLENNHENLTSIYECFGIIELKRNDFIKALDYFDIVLKMKERIFGHYHSSISSTLSAIALTHAKAGNSLNAIRNWHRTIQIESLLNKHEERKVAILHEKVGDEYFRILNYNSAIYHLMIFRNHLIKKKIKGPVLKKVTDKILKCYNIIGLEEYKSFNYYQAIDTYNSALNIINESKEALPRISHFIYFNLGNAYFKHGQLEQAKFYLDEALKIRALSIVKEPLLVGKSYNSLGNVELSKKNFISAKDLYQKAYSIFFSALGSDHEYTKLLLKKINDL
jgi:tetratricopeptide (TPR) repeat protein